MSNSQKVRTKKVPIELDKPRTLFYNLNAYIEIEDKYGSIEAAMKLAEAGKIKPIRDLLWVGLLHEDDTLKAEQVGNIVGIVELSSITDAIFEALGDSAPAPEDILVDNSNEGN